MKNVTYFLILFLAFFIFQLVFLVKNTLGIVIIVLVTIVALILMHKFTKVKLWDKSNIFNINKKDILKYYLTIYGLPMIFALILLLIFPKEILDSKLETKQDYVFKGLKHLSLPLLFKTCFAAAIIEELFLRKLMLDKFVEIKRVKLGILISAIAFGIGHPTGIFIPIFILIAVALSLIYLKTKSVLITMILHSVSNLGFLLTKFTSYTVLGVSISILFPLVFLTFLMYLGRIKNSRKPLIQTELDIA